MLSRSQRIYTTLIVFLVLLSVAITFPQAWHLLTGVNDFGDPLLNSWALSWGTHALVTSPTALLDGNMFFPERHTLALSETLLFPSLLVLPAKLAGLNPVGLHNLTLLSGYVLSGVTMFALVRHLTQDDRAALVSAVIFAVYPLRTEHYPRVQLQLTYLMPLALLQVHKLAEPDARWRSSAIVGALMACLFLSCVYYAVYLATILPLFALLVLAPRRAMKQGFTRLAVAAVVGAAILSPVIRTYFRNEERVGARARSEVLQGSAEARDYRRSHPVNWLYGNPDSPGPAERRLFPGYTTLLLTTAALLFRPAMLIIPYVATAALAADASLGLNGRTYTFLFDHLDPYRALRVPARFAMLVGMFLAVLAGMGVAGILSKVRRPLWGHVLFALALGGVVLEAANRPLTLRELPMREPAVYLWLRSAPSGAVIEYPVDGLEGRIGPQDPTYVYYSTIHWKPLLNGYSGFFPPSYHELLTRLDDFPSQASIDYLRTRDAKYLLVHSGYYIRGDFGADVKALSTLRNISHVATFNDPPFGTTVVYALSPSGSAPAQ